MYEVSTFPALSHVFVMGVPEGRVDSYTHIAGRTSRFGKALGKIVTVVEKIKEEVDDGKRRLGRRGW